MSRSHPSRLNLPTIANPPVYARDYFDQLESVCESGSVRVLRDPGLGVQYH